MSGEATRENASYHISAGNEAESRVSVLTKENLDDLAYDIGNELPIQTDGREIRFNLSTLDQVFDPVLARYQDEVGMGSLSAAETNQLRRDLIQRFQSAARPQSYAEPGHTVSSNRSSPEKIFLMVTPDEAFDTPELRIEKRAEWEALRQALIDAGARVEVVDGAASEDGSRETYARDRFIMIGNTAYLPDPDKLMEMQRASLTGFLSNPLQNHSLPDFDIQEYRREIDQAERFLSERGYEVIRVQGAWFEGGNIALHQRDGVNTLLSAVEPWNNSSSSEILARKINETQPGQWNLQTVPMGVHYAHNRFYHLDLGLGLLPEGQAMIFPGITNAETYEKLKNIIGEENIIEIDRDTASRYVTNFNSVGNTLIMTDTTPEMTVMLEDKGYRVVTAADYGQENFEFGLGGVHCLTNELNVINPDNANGPVQNHSVPVSAMTTAPTLVI